MIFNLLDPQGAVAFALTCKGLHEHYFRMSMDRLRLATRSQKRAMIAYLEGDIGRGSCYCPFCRKFHRWSHDQTLVSNDHLQHNTHLCSENPEYGFSANPFRASPAHSGDITYDIARLVMNRHLYGPEHGLPMSVLEKRENSEWKPISLPSRKHRPAAMHKEMWFVKIMMDELYLSRHLSLRFGPQGNPAPRAREYGMFGVVTAKEDFVSKAISLLQDIVSHPLLPRRWCITHGPDRTNGHTREHNLDECPRSCREALMTTRWRGFALKPTVFSCGTCLTDLEAHVSWTKGKGWEVNVTSFQLLGDLRSLHHDEKWTSLCRCHRASQALEHRQRQLPWDPRRHNDPPVRYGNINRNWRLYPVDEIWRRWSSGSGNTLILVMIACIWLILIYLVFYTWFPSLWRYT